MPEAMIEEGSYKDAKRFYERMSSTQIKTIQLTLIDGGYLDIDKFGKLMKFGKFDGYTYDAIVQAQKDMKKLGTYEGKIDGKFGSETKVAYNALVDEKIRKQEFTQPEEKKAPSMRLLSGMIPVKRVEETEERKLRGEKEGGKERDYINLEVTKPKLPAQRKEEKKTEEVRFICTAPGHTYYISFRSEPSSLINGNYFQLNNVASASEIVSGKRNPVTLSRQEINDALKYIRANLKEVTMKKSDVFVIE